MATPIIRRDSIFGVEVVSLDGETGPEEEQDWAEYYLNYEANENMRESGCCRGNKIEDGRDFRGD